MKGLKGERRAYGLISPLDAQLRAHGLKYKGSRIQRDNKLPWIIYESDKGSPVDLEAVDEMLLKQGYVHATDLDGKTEKYPQQGGHLKGQGYTHYRYEKRGGPHDYVVETIYLTTRNYVAGKGKKDFTNFEHIFY